MTKNITKVRTRFAPSPTGPLHMGGVRTALYCYLFARQQGGDFILRIEDTDQARFVPGAEEYIIESLKWAGIPADEGVGFADKGYGPYRQSDRKEIYRQYADELLKSGHAYYAFDTPEELENWRKMMEAQGNPSPAYNNVSRQYLKNSLTLPHDEVEKKLAAGEPYVIRFKMPRNEDVKFEDIIKGMVSFNSNQLDDKVLFKSDGMPTYHLANVVDDHCMEITHIIRGDEWLSSAPLHILLYRAFNWEAPQMAHLPLILKPDGKGKLSKRDGDRLGFPVFPLDWTDPQSGEKSSGFRERGYFPEAYLNMLAFLGWNPGTEQELFSMDELIAAFSLDRVSKHGAKFDPVKSAWFNQQYLVRKSDEELAEKIKPYMNAAGYTADETFTRRFCGMIKERCHFLADFTKEGYYFFEEVKSYDEAALKKKWISGKKERIVLLPDHLEKSATAWDLQSIESSIKQFAEAEQLGTGDLFPVLRIALAGVLKGPPVFDMMELLGKTASVQRLRKAFAAFDQMNG